MSSCRLNQIINNIITTSVLCILKVKGDNRCLYTALRRRLDCPVEYTSSHLKRQLIHYLALRAREFAQYCNNHILHEYNNPLLNKGFSYKSYLLYMLEDSRWGDTITLYSMFILFNLPISVLFPDSLMIAPIRHDIKDLARVDILVLHTGGLHYTTIGKGRHHRKKGQIYGIQVIHV